jgi:formylglycine-generating enzyme required for sulfatase activity
MAPFDVPAGTPDWPAAITKAIRECRVLVLLLTDASNGSKDVRKEVHLAEKYEKEILVVRLEEIVEHESLEYMLIGRQRLEAVGLAVETVSVEVIGSLGMWLPDLPAAPVVMPPPAPDPPPRVKKGPPEEWTNSLGMAFRRIPAGTFQMGSAGHNDEKPVHQIHISKPFYLGKYPVTQSEWKALMGTTPAQQRDKADKSWDLYGIGDRHPMYYVSWEEAQAFIAELNAREPGERYRLPTEAEWEYACRGGSETAYSFGDDASLLGEYARYDGNSDNETHPVGEKLPNGWGLYDMHGNVWEWVQDWYDEGYHKSSPATDPVNGKSGLVPGGPRRRLEPCAAGPAVGVPQRLHYYATRRRREKGAMVTLTPGYDGCRAGSRGRFRPAGPRIAYGVTKREACPGRVCPLARTALSGYASQPDLCPTPLRGLPGILPVCRLAMRTHGNQAYYA